MNFDAMNFDAGELCLSFDTILGVYFLHAFPFRIFFCEYAIFSTPILSFSLRGVLLVFAKNCF